MSYILEALRKAEQERNIGQVPVPAMIYALPTTAQRRAWPWIALTLALLANAGVLAALLLLRDRQVATPPVAQAQPAANVQIVIPPTAVVNQAQPQAAALPTTAAPAVSEPAPAAEPRAVPRRPPAPRAERPIRRAPVDDAPYAALDTVSEPRARGGRRVAADTPPAEDLDIPTESRLPDTAFAGGPAPELNMDVHVYSDQPGKRFVLINSRRYREGERLSEGPTVEAITQKGAILRYQGERFLLSVQNPSNR